MEAFQQIESRLREDQALLPDTLGVSFEAFEGIRLMARAHEDRVPGLFAAFMTTADAAVDGREALTIAPSLPSVRSTVCAGGTALSAGVDEIADAIARLAALLRDRLVHAAATAETPGDTAACKEAAGAARRIHHLMAAGHDDGHVR